MTGPVGSGESDNQPLIGRRSATVVAVSSVVSAASSYLVLLLSARVLSTADNAEFLAYWSMLFGLFGITTGLQPEFTRQAVLNRRGSGGSANGLRLGLVALGAGLLVGSLAWLSSPLWGQSVLGDKSVQLVLFISLGLIGHAVQMGLTGTLAGRQRWMEYSLLIATEALTRIGIVVLLILFLPGVESFAFGAAISTFVWVFALLSSKSARDAFKVRSVVSPRRLYSGIFHASASSMSSAVLVVGFPVLIRLTTPESDFLAAAPLLMAAALTRAPLMVPLMTYQSVAVTHFMREQERGIRALWPIARIVFGIGALGAILAALIGPWLMQALLGPAYLIGPWTFAGLTLAAAILAALTLSGALSAAMGRHGVYSGGWVAATLISLGILLIPGSVEWRAVLALLIGPTVGVLIHITALRRPKRSAALV